MLYRYIIILEITIYGLNLKEGCTWNCSIPTCGQGKDSEANAELESSLESVRNALINNA